MGKFCLQRLHNQLYFCHVWFLFPFYLLVLVVLFYLEYLKNFPVPVLSDCYKIAYYLKRFSKQQITIITRRMYLTAKFASDKTKLPLELYLMFYVLVLRCVDVQQTCYSGRNCDLLWFNNIMSKHLLHYIYFRPRFQREIEVQLCRSWTSNQPKCYSCYAICFSPNEVHFYYYCKPCKKHEVYSNCFKKWCKNDPSFQPLFALNVSLGCSCLSLPVLCRLWWGENNGNEWENKKSSWRRREGKSIDHHRQRATC